MAKDVATLVITGNNYCNDAINGGRRSEYIAFGVDNWIMIGSICHLAIVGFVILAGMGCIFGPYCSDYNCVFAFLYGDGLCRVGLCLFPITTAWMVIGTVPYLEMNGNGEEIVMTTMNGTTGGNKIDNYTKCKWQCSSEFGCYYSMFSPIFFK